MPVTFHDASVLMKPGSRVELPGETQNSPVEVNFIQVNDKKLVCLHVLILKKLLVIDLKFRFNQTFYSLICSIWQPHSKCTLPFAPAGLIFNPPPSQSWGGWELRGGKGVEKEKGNEWPLTEHPAVPGSCRLLFHFYNKISLINPTLQIGTLRLGGCYVRL